MMMAMKLPGSMVFRLWKAICGDRSFIDFDYTHSTDLRKGVPGWAAGIHNQEAIAKIWVL
jgi:hypothetical protein